MTDPDVETLAAEFHAVYQAEARRQGDVRHAERYEDLPENVKEFDRVLARHVTQRLSETEREREALERWKEERIKTRPKLSRRDLNTRNKELRAALRTAEERAERAEREGDEWKDSAEVLEARAERAEERATSLEAALRWLVQSRPYPTAENWANAEAALAAVAPLFDAAGNLDCSDSQARRALIRVRTALPSTTEGERPAPETGLRDHAPRRVIVEDAIRKRKERGPWESSTTAGERCPTCHSFDRDEPRTIALNRKTAADGELTYSGTAYCSDPWHTAERQGGR